MSIAVKESTTAHQLAGTHVFITHHWAAYFTAGGQINVLKARHPFAA